MRRTFKATGFIFECPKCISPRAPATAHIVLDDGSGQMSLALHCAHCQETSFYVLSETTSPPAETEPPPPTEP